MNLSASVHTVTKNNRGRAGEMANGQSTWFSRCEDLNSNPQNPCKARYGSTYMYSYAEMGGRHRRILKAFGPANKGQVKVEGKDQHQRSTSDLHTCT